MRTFLQELRRRNVYKVGVMYAVGGWLLVQVATQVLPIFEVSALTLRLIVLAIVAGFPVALVLSWVYEVTPEGIVKTSEVAPDRSIAHHTGQRLNYVIIGVLAIAVVFLLAQRWWLPRRPDQAAAAISDKSVAVLPFANLSEEKANAFFAEGIQDEILTRLAKIGALKVISRTSTQHYASNPGNLPEIARELGVANILEGSVQKVGDAVHINVQLIRAATDDHVWAEVYNRKLDDIFGVEGEVAGAIAEALNAKLSGTEREAVSSKPTENLAAYEAYLRGRSFNLSGGGYDKGRQSIEAYTEAVRLDPKFSQAWAQLAINMGYLYFNNVDRDRYSAQSIKLASDTALQLQPQSSEAQLAQGSYLYRVQRDFAGAQVACEAILKHDPNNVLALQMLGFVERRQGHWDESLAHHQQAMSLDPRNSALLTAVGYETLVNMRRYDEGRQYLDRALALSPGDTWALGYKASSYQVEGRLEEAARVLESKVQNPLDPGVAYYRAYQRLLERNFTQAIAEVAPILAQPEAALNGYGPQLRLDLGIAQQAAGQKAQAQATFEKLVAQIEPQAEQIDDSLVPVTLAEAYARAGKQAAALRQAQRAVELFGNDAIQGPLARQALAEVQMIGGEHDAAVATLEPLLNVASGVTPAQLRLDPVWDPLRGNPRFEALLKTLKQPPTTG
jgi:TolB-like protein/cytochrome c-type biogenesis protein CcmH/NrfG